VLFEVGIIRMRFTEQSEIDGEERGKPRRRSPVWTAVERGFWSSVEERGTGLGPEVHH
jgi:hypothetical protein